MSIQVADICGYYGVHIWRFLRQSKFGSVAGPGVRVGSRTDLKPQTFYVRSHLVRSTGQRNTACSLSAGVSKPKVFRGR